MAALTCVFASTGMAQIGSYMGPGIMSNGAGTVGQRSGEAVNFRYYIDASGVYDNGLQPFAVDSKGNLLTVNGLYGEQLDFGAYGTHAWRNALLGLNFSGNFYHYQNDSQYDGSTENLALGYTWQKSRRLIFDLREIGGTSSLGYGQGVGLYEASTSSISQPNSILFDNRIYYVQSSMDVTYLLSARTSVSAGGDGFWVHRDAVGLASTQGYNLRGTIQHRISKAKTVGFRYQHMYYDFPPAFGESTTDMGLAFFATSLGRRWTAQIDAGAFYTSVVGVQQVSLNPVVAALLGTSVGYQAFTRQSIYPAALIDLTAHLHHSSLSLHGGQTVTPGNGIYLTSRQTTATGAFSYTGIQKWNFGISGGYSKLDSIGQGLKPYSYYTGGAGFTYGLTRSLHLIGRYDARHQEIMYADGYKNTGARVSFGIAFSPGDIPLSLW
jgi:hypothetical protein